jgi:quercetin dioxygenase-like cupin family protein
MRTIRRVVAGVDSRGLSAVLLDESLDSEQPRLSVWATDRPIPVPSAETTPDFKGPLLPIAGGVHILMLKLPPAFRRGPIGMHDTPTFDCIFQLSGESVLVLDDSETKLHPGDWLVCNGVRHDWRNDGDTESVMIGVIYGGLKSAEEK